MLAAASRIWRAFGLKPHQTETFKLSPDPQFIDKVRDIVGLYLNPPDAAVVLYALGDLTKAQYIMRRQALEEELQRQGPPAKPAIDRATALLELTVASHAGRLRLDDCGSQTN